MFDCAVQRSKVLTVKFLRACYGRRLLYTVLRRLKSRSSIDGRRAMCSYSLNEIPSFNVAPATHYSLVQAWKRFGSGCPTGRRGWRGLLQTNRLFFSAARTSCSTAPINTTLTYFERSSEHRRHRPSFIWITRNWMIKLYWFRELVSELAAVRLSIHGRYFTRYITFNSLYLC